MSPAEGLLDGDPVLYQRSTILPTTKPAEWCGRYIRRLESSTSAGWKTIVEATEGGWRPVPSPDLKLDAMLLQILQKLFGRLRGMGRPQMQSGESRAEPKVGRRESSGS